MGGKGECLARREAVVGKMRKDILRVRVCLMILLEVQMARVHALDNPTVHLLRGGTMLWADDSSS